MRFWKSCCLLLALTLLTGCGKNMERAHQIADQNLYQNIAYENAAQPGPTVAVLPGDIRCASYEFRTRVNPDNIRDFGEMELGKANFKVIEKSSLPDIYKEIEIAVNLGDGSMAKRFKKLKTDPPQWIVLFDVPDVKTQTTEFHFTDKNSASFAGALMGSILLGASGAQLGEGVVGSINSAEEQRKWDITMRYRILDGTTGALLHEGEFKEQASINSELKGFLGVDAAESGGVSLSTVTQRLVQKAVQDMDKQFKLAAMAEPEPAPQPGKKGGKGKKAAPKAAPGIALAAKADAPEIACEKTSFGGFACQFPSDWSTGEPPSALQAAVAQKPQLGELIKQRRSGKSSLIDTVVAFDVLRTAGPLVTLTEPDSPLSKMGKAVAINGADLEGRIFVFPGAGSELTPEKLAGAIEGHMRRASVLEPLAVETVDAADGTKRPIMVYKYIKIEQKREKQEKPEWDDEKKDTYKFLSIPHYNNMAMSIIPKGNDLMLVIVIAPEDKFIPRLEEAKKLIGSAA